MYIGVAVAIIVVLGAGYYFMSNGTSGTPTLPDYSGTTPAGDESAYEGSIAGLAARGGSYTCSVNNGGGTEQTVGGIYINGTQMRGDFTSTVNGNAVESHMIRNADVMYVWSGAQLQGVKMTVPAAGTPGTATTPTGMSDGIDQNTNYAWKCEPWTADQSKFTPPSSVTFIDASAMMKGGTMPKIPGY